MYIMLLKICDVHLNLQIMLFRIYDVHDNLQKEGYILY